MADFGTLSADGDTDDYKVAGDNGVWMHVDGTFGSGTYKIQAEKPDGSTFFDVVDASYTTDDDKILLLPHGTIIKGNLAGASGPTLYWQFKSIAPRRSS